MKKSYAIVSALTAIILLFSACKKETTIKVEYNPNIGIYGVWKFTGNIIQGFEDHKFVEFNTNKICHVYTANSLGFRSAYSAGFSPYPDQVIADITANGQALVYNYHFSGDTLILKISGLNIPLLKAQSADVAGWSEEVSPGDQITGLFTNRAYGIGFDGTNLLLPDYSNSILSKFNLSTRLPAGDIPVSGSYPMTVLFDGTDLWVSSNGYDKINRHPLAGGSILSSSPVLGPWVYGIAFDPAASHIWAYSGNDDSLFQFNKNTNALISTRYIGDGFYDMTWLNGKLYIVRGSYIYRINTTGFIIEKTYKLKTSENIYGITAVGSDFWLNIEGNKFVKVTLN